MSRPISDSYIVTQSIGTFADEAGFKRGFINDIKAKDKGLYRSILAIENTVEPGMPDLLMIDNEHKAYFAEIKYARKGIITFKKTQIPWYKRHLNLHIFIAAYNDKTKNIHLITADCLLSNTENTSYKLKDEEGFI